MGRLIKRTVDLNARIGRVWSALTDYEEFGSWFGVSLRDPFQPGEITTGEVVYPGHEGLKFWARVEEMDEPRRFSFVWPTGPEVFPDDPNVRNKVTLVEFLLEPSGEKTRLTVCESGFEMLPDSKQDQVYRDNSGGWDVQVANFKRYLE